MITSVWYSAQTDITLNQTLIDAKFCVEYKQIGLVCAILREKTVHLSFESMSGPYFEHFTK